MRRGAIVILASVLPAVLIFGFFEAASTLQEDLRNPVLYAARHAQSGDAIALPDHAITAASQYYLSSERRVLSLWPQLGLRQPYVEGFDLESRPSFIAHSPRRVWLLTDNTVPGVTQFERDLDREGYMLWEVKPFDGVSLLLYYFARPVTSVLPFAHEDAVEGSVAVVAGANSDQVTNTNVQYELRITRVQLVLSAGSNKKIVIGTARSTIYPNYYLLQWNSTTVPNGTYALQSRATNGAGRSSDSSPIRITVKN